MCIARLPQSLRLPWPWLLPWLLVLASALPCLARPAPKPHRPPAKVQALGGSVVAKSAETLALAAAAQRLGALRGRGLLAPGTIADALAIGRLSGAVPPALLADALEPLAVRWLGDKAAARTPTGTVLRTLVLAAARRTGRTAGVERWQESDGQVQAWAWLGPFGDEHGSAFDREGPVELQARRSRHDVARAEAEPHIGRQGPVRWQPVPLALQIGTARLPLDELVDRSDDAIVYAQAWIKPDKPGQVYLRLAADGPVRVWLDGAPLLQVSAKPELHGIAAGCPDLPEIDTATVTLQAGWQRLLVKLAPSAASLPLSLRFTDLRGEPVAIASLPLAPTDVQAAVASTTADAVPELGFQTDDSLPADAVAGVRWPLSGSVKGQSPHVARGMLAALVALAWHGWPMAAALSERLLAAFPEELPAVAQVALAHAMLAGEPGDRIDRLRQWQTLLPDSAELLVAQAEAIDGMGKTAAAHRLWREWATRTGRDPEDESVRACLVRSGLWTRLGADLVAKGLLHRCGANWPDVPELLEALARDAAARDQLTQAAAHLGHLARLEPGALARQMAWLTALIDAGDTAAAQTLGIAIEQQFPGRSRAAEAVAQMWLAEQQPERADATLQRLPGHLQRTASLELRGRIAARLGQREAAIAHLRAAVAAAPSRPELRARLQLLRPDGDFFAPYRRDLVALARREATQPLAYPVESRLRQTVIQVVGNGQQARYDAEVIYIGRGSDGSRDVTIEYAPTLSRAEVLQAAVVHQDGRVERTATQEVEAINEDDSGMYYDLERITLGFRNLRPGDAILVEYTVRDLGPTPFGLVFGELMPLGDDHPVRETEVVVQLPAGTPFFHALHDPLASNGPLAPNGSLAAQKPPPQLARKLLPASGADRDDQGPWDQWRLQLGPMAAVSFEERMPGLTDVVPYLHLSSFPSWAAAARWYAGLMAEALPPRGTDPALRELALRLTQGATTTEQKVRAIHAYATMQVRYVGLEFGIHSLKPHPAREVLQRQFGDCKDKATLMTALLGEVGIDAQPVLVRTLDQGRLHDAVASLGVFNHAIAYVPELDWWLDATATHHGPFELPDADAGGTALRIPVRQGTATAAVPDKPVRLPEPLPNAQFQHEAIELHVATDGSARLTLSLQAKGLPAAQVRARLWAAQTRKERLEQDLAPRFPGIEVQTVAVQGIDPPADAVSVQVEGRVPQWARVRQGGLATAPLRPPQPYLQVLAPLDKRVHELALSYGFRDVTRLRVLPPPGWQVTRLPTAVQLPWQGGQFDLEVQQEPTGAATLTATFALGGRRVAAAAYPAMRQWLGAVDAALRGELVMTPVPAAASGGGAP